MAWDGVLMNPEGGLRDQEHSVTLMKVLIMLGKTDCSEKGV